MGRTGKLVHNYWVPHVCQGGSQQPYLGKVDGLPVVTRMTRNACVPLCLPLCFYYCCGNIPICFSKPFTILFTALKKKKKLQVLPLMHKKIEIAIEPSLVRWMFAPSCLQFKNFHKDNRSRWFQPESKFNGEIRSNPQRVNYSSSN